MDFKDYESKEHVFVLFSFSTRYIFWNFVGRRFLSVFENNSRTNYGGASIV